MGLLAIVDLFNGDHQEASQKFVMAFGIVGVGHKIEKSGKK